MLMTNYAASTQLELNTLIELLSNSRTEDSYPPHRPRGTPPRQRRNAPGDRAKRKKAMLAMSQAVSAHQRHMEMFFRGRGISWGRAWNMAGGTNKGVVELYKRLSRAAGAGS